MPHPTERQRIRIMVDAVNPSRVIRIDLLSRKVGIGAISNRCPVANCKTCSAGITDCFGIMWKPALGFHQKFAD
jgi:hypothetical protein